jgi:hypothetical protein
MNSIELARKEETAFLFLAVGETGNKKLTLKKIKSHGPCNKFDQLGSRLAVRPWTKG